MAFNRSMGMLSGDPRYDLGAPTTSMGVGQQLGGMFGKFAGQGMGRDMRSSEQIQKATTGKAVQAALSSGDPMKVREIAGQIASSDATLALKLLDIAKKLESDNEEKNKVNARQQVIINSIQASDLSEKDKADIIKLYATGSINEEDVLKRTGFIKSAGQGFTLGEGQVRYDAEGRVIAEGKPKEKETKVITQPSVSKSDVETLNAIIKDNPDLEKAFTSEGFIFDSFDSDKVKAKAADIYLEQKTNGGTLADAARRVVNKGSVDNGGYKVGEVVKGMRYKGGGYNNPSNWEKVNG